MKLSIKKSKKIYENSKAFNTVTSYEKMLAQRKTKKSKPNTGRESLKTFEVNLMRT